MEDPEILPLDHIHPPDNIMESGDFRVRYTATRGKGCKTG